MDEWQGPDGLGGLGNGGSRRRRPRIRPPRSTAERVFLALAVIALLGLLAVTAYWWPALPAIIPTHFGIDGRPNAYGSKNTFFFLPALLLVMTVSFALLSRYPWIFNYPVVITQQNAARQYQRGRQLLAVVNAVVGLVFVVAQWQTIQLARGAATDLGPLFSLGGVLALVLLLPILAIVLLVWWSSRAR